MVDEKKITEEQGLDILIKNISDVIFISAVTALSITDPTWTMLFLTGKGIFGTWSDFGQTRVNEIVVDLEKNKESFDPEVLKTDKFKSVFLSVLERHMKESSEERRIILRNYLIAVAQGNNPEFNYHTKLLNILDQITGDELRLFMLLPTIIQDSQNEKLAYSSEEEKRRLNLSEVEMNSIQVKMRLKGWKIKTKNLTALLRFLTNYGLINTYDISVSGIGGGGSNDLMFAGLSETGKAFHDFMSNSFYEKEIITFLEYKKDPSLSLGLHD